MEEIKSNNEAGVSSSVKKNYNLQEILIKCGVTKEMWERQNHKELPWIIQWFKVSDKLYYELDGNSNYDAFFMGLSNDAELWYEDADDQHYAYFEPEDMSIECYKWDELLDHDDYVEVRITDIDDKPLKDNEGNWIKNCTPGDMKLLLIVDYGAGDSILNDLVEYIESDEEEE